MKNSWVWIAAALLGIAVAVFFLSRESGQLAGVYDDLHVQCSACGHPFTMTARVAAEQRAAAGDPRKPLICPSCGKATGVTMNQCDKCQAWFLPDKAAAAAAYKCPKCGFDPGL